MFISLGRYLKYSRTLSQSTWLIEGERGIKINSIEEILNNVLQKEIGATGKASLFLQLNNMDCSLVLFILDTQFSASGREDIDVKCLGTG